MSQVFHDIEKKIIQSLQENGKQTSENLERLTQLSPDQIRRGIEWLKLKNLAIIDVTTKRFFTLDKNGIESKEKGLPERRLLKLLKSGPKKISDLQQELGSVFGPAMGLSKRNNWVETNSDEISLKTDYNQIKIPGEQALNHLQRYKRPEKDFDQGEIIELNKRPEFIIESIEKTKEVFLTESAKSIQLSESSGAIDVEAEVPQVFVARTHPLKDTIDEIREIFVTLGFSEIFGNMTQSSFWNFDALFTPQDHPARELQDTFYLDGISAKKIGTSDQIRKVSKSHKKKLAISLGHQ